MVFITKFNPREYLVNGGQPRGEHLTMDNHFKFSLLPKEVDTTMTLHTRECEKIIFPKSECLEITESCLISAQAAAQVQTLN